MSGTQSPPGFIGKLMALFKVGVPPTQAPVITAAAPTRTETPRENVPMSDVKIHPAVDGGLKHGTPGFAGGTLQCLCAADPVMVRVDSDVMHNHACGCSKCWKPAGAVFSVVGVVPRDKVQVTSNNDKLHVVDESATIQRHACRVCGAHLFGRIEKEHAFHGLDFIHSELSPQSGWAPPGFAAFVSSIIEQGAPVSKMGAVRDRLSALGLPPYDVLNPPLMDALASYTAKQHGVLHE